MDDDFVPARDEKVNDDPKVQRWLIDAKRKVERFDDGASDDWIGHFFGEQHLEVARKVLETMPTALQMWLDGEFKIVNRPLYERTNTLNAVRSADGLLSVSPGFLTGGNGNVDVLIHESAHGAGVVDRSIPYVDDIAYEGADTFHELRPSERTRNADHYRACVQLWPGKEEKLRRVKKFAVVNPDSDGGGGKRGLRTIEGDWTYARYVTTECRNVFQDAWLRLFDLMIMGTQAYHDERSDRGGVMRKTLDVPYMGGEEAEVRNTQPRKELKSALPGKREDRFKAKDYARLEDLYGRARDWIDYLDRVARYTHVYDEDLRGNETVALQKNGAGRIIQTLSNFRARNQMIVDNESLARGVKRVIDIVLEERPYPKVSRKDVIKWAVDRNKGPTRPTWYWYLEH